MPSSQPPTATLPIVPSREVTLANNTPIPDTPTPDSQWMAVQDTNGTLSVLHPDNLEEHQVTRIPSENLAVRWFFDSQHLLMMEHTFDMKADRNNVNISLVSIKDGNILPVAVTGLNTENFLIDDLFWQGGKSKNE